MRNREERKRERKGERAREYVWVTGRAHVHDGVASAARNAQKHYRDGWRQTTLPRAYVFKPQSSNYGGLVDWPRDCRRCWVERSDVGVSALSQPLGHRLSLGTLSSYRRRRQSDKWEESASLISYAYLPALWPRLKLSGGDNWEYSASCRERIVDSVPPESPPNHQGPE
jgi:hypothetical protein